MKNLNDFPFVIWINLQRNPDRASYMSKLLNTHNIQSHRLEAIDGNHLNHYSFITANTSITPHENACTASHVLALWHFITKTKLDKVVIFEDDTSFEFLPYIKQYHDWTHFESSLPVDYDLIQLCITTQLGKVAKTQLTKTNRSTSYYSSGAYLITRTAACKLLKLVMPHVNLDDADTCSTNHETNPIIDMAQLQHARADHFLFYLGSTYSIPMFSYQLFTSNINAHMLSTHHFSKLSQLTAWKH
ncbi:Glycosyltransferase family 25 (LPS biosynthesis protein) [uncultured virus]|nr:Glycosyltransferase family 25 (LPS biosynthesis protein) [uncultured virus]